MTRAKIEANPKTDPELRKAVRETYLKSASGINRGSYSGSNYEWGRDPDPFVVTMSLFTNKSELSVLDLGCGYGRNSIYLAKIGYSVTAVDNSTKAISMLKRDAKIRDVKLDAITASVVSHEIKGSFDVVLMIRVLHELMQEEAVRLVDSAKRHTNSGGLNVVQMLTSEALGGFFYTQDELGKLYRDWNVRNYTAKGRTYDGYPEAHIIAQKP